MGIDPPFDQAFDRTPVTGVGKPPDHRVGDDRTDAIDLLQPLPLHSGQFFQASESLNQQLRCPFPDMRDPECEKEPVKRLCSGFVDLTMEVCRRCLAPPWQLRNGGYIEIPQRCFVGHHAGLDQLRQHAIAETVDPHRTA